MKTLSSLRSEAESKSALWFDIMHDPKAREDRGTTLAYAISVYNYYEGMVDAYNNVSHLMPQENKRGKTK